MFSRELWILFLLLHLSPQVEHKLYSVLGVVHVLVRYHFDRVDLRTNFGLNYRVLLAFYLF